MASETQKMKKKGGVQMQDQGFNEQHSISVIFFLTEFERSNDSSRVHEWSAVWLFRKFMSSSALVIIKAGLTL